MRARAEVATAALASAGCTKSPDFLLGATECERRAEEDARESGADQRSLLVIRIVKFVGHFSEQRTLSLVNSLVFHSGLRILNFAQPCPSLSRTVQRIRLMGFRKNSLYVMHPLGTCPLGFSKRPLRVRVSEFASRVRVSD